MLFPAVAWAEDVRPAAYAYYFRQWNAFDMPFHRHDSTEIMYLIRGSCRIEVARDGGPPEDVTLSHGEFIVVAAGVPHRLIVEGSCRMLNVEFGFATSGAGVPSIRALAREEKALAALLQAPVTYAVLRDPDEVYHALRGLVLELDALDAGGGRGADGGGPLVSLLFAQLLIRIARLRDEAESEAAPQAELYVRKCIEFMRQHYDRDIQAKDVAAAVNLHPGYVHRLFKSQSGRTITEYLTGLRMEKAKMLLLRTDIPIADISDYVGVGSRQYFHALFKRHTGMTPVQFRQTMDAHRWDDGERR
ncbi:AraC family transcriptional regulator [Paenibacillus antri]|uniref:AraC family transcriptional regulator n=1 Tax=Paenibacillus antri TaxID=2582848 RepID=A0A5R9G990_9BACL|nr:AraC family transcriptional regulator [Paenibacillus antri]TLS49634.1 AraC family transcriptional regulator [Paenibacillus antri]